VFVRRPGLRVGLRLTRRSVWHPEVKFAFGDPQERLSVSLLEGTKRRITGSMGRKSPANKAFSKTYGIRAGHAKNRWSFTPILATERRLFAECFERERRDSNPRPPA
jgi:hypothetical protein